MLHNQKKKSKVKTKKPQGVSLRKSREAFQPSLLQAIHGPQFLVCLFANESGHVEVVRARTHHRARKIV